MARQRNVNPRLKRQEVGSCKLGQFGEPFAIDIVPHFCLPRQWYMSHSQVASRNTEPIKNASISISNPFKERESIAESFRSLEQGKAAYTATPYHQTENNHLARLTSTSYDLPPNGFLSNHLTPETLWSTWLCSGRHTNDNHFKGYSTGCFISNHFRNVALIIIRRFS